MDRQSTARPDPIAFRHPAKNHFSRNGFLLSVDKGLDLTLVKTMRVLCWTPNRNLMSPPELSADAPIFDVGHPMIVNPGPAIRIKSNPWFMSLAGSQVSS